MTPEINAKISEIEGQRNMFATRCAELAAQMATLRTEIAALKAEKAAAEEAEAKKAE